MLGVLRRSAVDYAELGEAVLSVDLGGSGRPGSCVNRVVCTVSTVSMVSMVTMIWFYVGYQVYLIVPDDSKVN